MSTEKVEKIELFICNRGERFGSDICDDVDDLEVNVAYDTVVNEEYVTQLEQRLADAEKVIEFYADPFNWHPYQDKTNGEIWDNDSEWVVRNKTSRHLPGKRARAYKERWK